MTEYTEDKFLNGRLLVRQPVDGYRAGADPVFLAAAVDAKPGQSVLELGCGSGVAMLCLLSRIQGGDVTGVERDPDSAALAAVNLQNAGLGGHVIKSDIQHLTSEFKENNFDHVMANPPFFNRARGNAAPNSNREAGRGEDTPLEIWLDVAIRRLKPKGTLTLIYRADRLPQIFRNLDGRIGDLVALPLAARNERAAKLVILRGIKGANGPFRLAPPFILHKGDRHERDQDSYTPDAQSILRDGNSFDPRLLNPR